MCFLRVYDGGSGASCIINAPGRLLAEPPGKARLDLPWCRRKPGALKHIPSEGVALSWLSPPQLWKRKPRGLQCPGTVLLEIWQSGGCELSGTCWEGWLGKAGRPGDTVAGVVITLLGWSSALREQQESLPRAAPHRALCQQGPEGLKPSESCQRCPKYSYPSHTGRVQHPRTFLASQEQLAKRPIPVCPSIFVLLYSKRCSVPFDSGNLFSFLFTPQETRLFSCALLRS